MASKPLRIVVVLVIAGIIGGVTYYRQMSQMTTRSITGRVLSIDPATRKASMEFTHPKTGKTFQLSGVVPPECSITIDGRIGTLDEIKAGETIEVYGTLYRSGEMHAQRVTVRRGASQPTSAPASSQLGGPSSTQPAASSQSSASAP